MTEVVKAWPFNGYAPGNYNCWCAACDGEFIGDKRSIRCLECAVIASKETRLAHAGPPENVEVRAMVERLRKGIPCRDAQDGSDRWETDPDAEHALMTEAADLLERFSVAGVERRLLKQVLDAIATGRSEPLFIIRDAVRNHLEDAASLSTSPAVPRANEPTKAMVVARYHLHEGLTAALPSDERGWLLRARFQKAYDVLDAALSATTSGKGEGSE